MPQPFDYSPLFVQPVTEARNLGSWKRGKYDFAIAYPDPASIPLQGLVDGLQQAMDEEGEDLALYLSTQGYRPLREFIAAKLDRYSSMKVSADDLLLTGGGGQAIHIALETLIRPGDVILAEDFTYSGALWQMNRFAAEVRGVKTDSEGFLPDALEAAIQQVAHDGKRLKLIYCVATFQNPQGWTMSLERRKELVRLAQHYGVPILEDDCYADLRYDGIHLPTLYSLDQSGLVIYVGSFSKTIGPGMRTGFLAAARPMLERAISAKSGGPVPLFVTFAIHRYVKEHFASHVEEINDIQCQRRDAMLESLDKHFGHEAEIGRPEGGLSIWVKLPADRNVIPPRERILEQYDVGYVPGVSFDPQRSAGKNFFRLSFGYNTPEQIHEGIAALAKGFRQEGLLKGY